MIRSQPPRRLDAGDLRKGVAILSARDPRLARIVSLHGPPPLWSRRPGFASLARIILEQQVSLASGRAIFRRVSQELGTVSARAVLQTGAEGLRRIGVTRQKASYLVDAAERTATGRLSLSRVARARDSEARDLLMEIKGVGRWTADIYLLMALGRPDVWPRGDVALVTALRHLRSLQDRPPHDQAAVLAAAWTPWRSVAARILWHGYLEGSLRTAASRGRPQPKF